MNGRSKCVDGESSGLAEAVDQPIGRFSEDDALKISHACQMLV